MERGAGYDCEVGLRGDGGRLADEGGDGVVAGEGFGEGEGACSAAGTEEEDTHGGFAVVLSYCLVCIVVRGLNQVQVRIQYANEGWMGRNGAA